MRHFNLTLRPKNLRDILTCTKLSLPDELNMQDTINELKDLKTEQASP
jgi:hypothetical protein